MSNLKVEINYQSIATLCSGIKSQIEREDLNGLRGSVELLCKQLDKAILTAEVKDEKKPKNNFFKLVHNKFLEFRSNRIRRS